MSRISGINIPATVGTKGVTQGLERAKRDVAKFRTDVDRMASSPGGAVARGTAFAAAGIGGAGGRTMALGGALGGAGGVGLGVLGGLSGIVTLLSRISATQIQARDLLASGANAADLLRAGINPAFAGRLAQNAPGTNAGPFDAFSQSLGTYQGFGAMGNALRQVGGTWGSIIGQALQGRFDWLEAGRMGNLAGAEGVNESMRLLREYGQDDPRYLHMLREMEHSARSERRQ